MSTPDALMLGDQLGPRGRRRVWMATAVAAVVLLVVLVVALRRLQSHDQLEWERWEPFTQWEVQRFLLLGLVNTLKAAALAMGFALVLGAALALLRLSQTAPLRWLAAAFVEFFRGVPLILLILFSYIGLRAQGIDISAFRALVLALAVYNGAVLGEVFRAGIRSLDRGQTEAAYAIGLSYWQAMLLVVIPQAARRMVPAIVSQMVTLLKDTSLGFVIVYDELLRRGRNTGQFFRNPLQAFVVVAVVYIIVNFALSRLAVRLEVRQRRRLGADAIVVTGVDDLLGVGVAGAGEVGYGSGVGGGASSG
ncbi:MAG TPA: amino acid ABC transporter permease [Acidimicrobiales bacterium]|nr:amino acid ABC transporter permease [Acidimicrobiales bacterium]